MSPATVRAVISGENGELDPRRIRSAQAKVKDLVSHGESVLVVIESPNTGKMLLAIARNYSRNNRDLRKEIRRMNGLFLITVLRSAGVPTHSSPFDSTGKAIAFLKGKKVPVAAVV